MALVVMPMTLLFRGLAMIGLVAADVPLHPADFLEAGLLALLVTTAGWLGAWAGAGRDPGWVKITDAGLEFKAARNRAVFLPWAGVASARLRLRGPFTRLIVTPAGPEAVFFARTPGRLPRMHRGAFTIEAGLMTPGPATLLAEIDDHRQP
jgi:hypothetical protein